MRGYRQLKRENRLPAVSELKDRLTTRVLRDIGDRASALIFGAARPHAERAVRQYLMMRFGNSNRFNESVLGSIGDRSRSIAFPMPSEWREVLREQGYRVAGFRAAVTWHLTVFLFFGAGVVAVVKRVGQAIIGIGRKELNGLGRHAYFHGLSAGSLPQPGTDGQSHDILSWYQQWPDRRRDLESLVHEVASESRQVINGVQVVGGQAAVPSIGTVSALVQFIAWSLRSIAVALVDLLRGRWWTPLMLREASNAAIVRYEQPDRLATDYLFHNSDWVYRPLFTYEAERKGSRILFYFYSANIERFQHRDGYRPLVHGWKASNWPLHLVWDEWQAEFLRRVVGAGARVDVVGPIWFQSPGGTMPRVPAKAIAVFDVIPFRSSFYERLALETEFYVPENSEAFLRDIQRVAAELGYTMLWKRKREMGQHTHPRYRRTAARLAGLPNVESLDAELSAIRLIDASTLAISMPFTSTALLARAAGKPSCYYDPHGLLRADDHAAHGIEIVQGFPSLREWVTRSGELSMASTTLGSSR
jgi:polysaccharide biosynthesis PFTS motif protein